MANIDDCFRLAFEPAYFYQFIVESALRQAELSSAIEEYVQELHQAPNPGAAEAAYAKELRREAQRLCENYGSQTIMPQYRKALGEQRFCLYFGNN